MTELYVQTESAAAIKSAAGLGALNKLDTVIVDQLKLRCSRHK